MLIPDHSGERPSPVSGRLDMIHLYRLFSVVALGATLGHVAEAYANVRFDIHPG